MRLLPLIVLLAGCGGSQVSPLPYDGKYSGSWDAPTIGRYGTVSFAVSGKSMTGLLSGYGRIVAAFDQSDGSFTGTVGPRLFTGKTVLLQGGGARGYCTVDFADRPKKYVVPFTLTLDKR